MMLLDDLIEISTDDSRATPPARRPRHRLPLVGVALALTAVVLTVVALPQLAAAPAHPFGLLFAGPVVYVVAIVLGPLGFCVALAARSRPAAWIALIATVLVTRLPVTLATAMPLYSWTYKHFGVVDFIQDNGSLARGIDIYHSWPGLFALVAWINELTGVDTLLIAHWFTPVFQLAFTFAMYVFARAFGLTRDASLVAALIAQLVNWVAQDYLSPQAVALFLGLAVIALLVQSRRYLSAPWIALILFAAITMTHQLTPYWLVMIVVALSILGYVRPRWIAVMFVAVVLGYLAVNYEIVASYGSLFSFNAVQNVKTNGLGVGSTGQQFSSLAGRATTLLLWGSAAIAFLVSLIRVPRTRRRTLAAGVIAFASFALLLGQGYGGEAIFRVMLYSIPGCSLLIAPVVTAMLLGPVRSHRPVDASRRVEVRATLATRRRRRRLTQFLIAPVIALVALASAQAYYGGWFANRVTQESFAASTHILETAPTDAIMIGLAPGAPGRTVGRYVDFARANNHFDLGVEAWEGWLGADFSSSYLVSDMTNDLLYSQQQAYVIITEQMKEYSDYYGMFPDDAVQRFEDQLLANPHWDVVEQSDTMVVLELVLESVDG